MPAGTQPDEISESVLMPRLLVFTLDRQPDLALASALRVHGIIIIEVSGDVSALTRLEHSGLDVDAVLLDLDEPAPVCWARLSEMREAGWSIPLVALAHPSRAVAATLPPLDRVAIIDNKQDVRGALTVLLGSAVHAQHPDAASRRLT